MASRKILVLGATGKQGHAVISALLAEPSTPPLHILAVTRNPSSASAQSLVSSHPDAQITPVQGDFSDPAPVFAHPSVGADVATLYLFTMPRTPEDVLGKAWIDAAVAHNVAQIILCTVDRGGDAKSWSTPTDIPHFAQKHAVELHLRELAQTHRSLRWTILRPTCFFENMGPGFFGSVFAAAWAASLPADKKLQFVSTRDIGLFAARAVADPDGWNGKAVGLAGDELTYAEGRDVFRRVVGLPLPQAWGLVGRGLLWAVPDVGKMFAWFATDGYGADIAALKKMEPRLQDFEAWLRESSKWEVQK